MYVVRIVFLVSVCVDIEECSESNGGCQQLCTELEGGFQCSCHDGFVLTYDNRTCSGNHSISACNHNNFLILLMYNYMYVALIFLVA